MKFSMDDQTLVKLGQRSQTEPENLVTRVRQVMTTIRGSWEQNDEIAVTALQRARAALPL